MYIYVSWTELKFIVRQLNKGHLRRSLLFRSYISSLIKPFKHNTIRTVRLLLRSQESNLLKPLKPITVLGIRLSYKYI